MSNEYVSRLRLAGEAEAMQAFALAVRDGDDHFYLDEAALAGLGLTDGDIRLVAETNKPEMSSSNGLAVVEYLLVTRRGAPWDLAERLSAKHDMVASLASVEPGNRIAEVRVYGHGQEWRSEMLDFDYDAVKRKCEGEGADVEAGILDELQSDSCSVVDDYEKGMPTSTLQMS